MKVYQVGRHRVEVGFDVFDVDIIRRKTPVRTGLLRDSFTIDVNGDIVNHVYYASYVEFGTVKMAGYFMCERSLIEIGRRLKRRIAKQIDQLGLIVLPDIILKVGR